MESIIHATDIFPDLNEVAGRYCFHRHVSFCPGGGVKGITGPMFLLGGRYLGIGYPGVGYWGEVSEVGYMG